MFLKRPLLEAKVSLLLAADSTVVIESIPIREKRRFDDGTLEEAQFWIEPERKTCKYLIRATLDGYEDGYQPLAIDEKNDASYKIDPLELRRMRQINLDEVTVKATKVKMYWKGDTLVYDATAFQLPDGSMLDDLIKQMPGVRMTDEGEIFVNGRKIDELQLGSRSFMRGNQRVLLENLPYHTVKDIKVYEQDTDLNRALGAQVEKKKYVMDVNLKPEYRTGYMANVEAAGGTEERWLGRAFLLGFTSRTRYTFLANSNNVNESGYVKSNNHWRPSSVPKSLQTTHSVAGEIDYRSEDKNMQETLTVDFASTRDDGKMVRRSELYLQDSPTQETHQNSLAREKRLQMGNRFKYIKPGGFEFETNADLNYKSYSGNSLTQTDQYVSDLTMRQRTDGLNDGNAWATKFYARIRPAFRKGWGWLTTHFDYTSDENQHAQRFLVEDFVNPSSTRSHNSNDYSNRNMAVYVPIYYGRGMGPLCSGSIAVSPSYSREKTHDWLYHPDTLMLPSEMDRLQAVTDRGNSYRSDLQSYKSDITLDFNVRQKLPPRQHNTEGGYDFLYFALHITPMHEKLHYQRGSLDTLATRSTVRFEPRLDIHLFVKKDSRRPVLIRVAHSESNSPLVNQIVFRDDATPLVVRLGNPDLKPWRSESFVRAEYNDHRSTRHGFDVRATYRYFHQEVSQAVSFNPTTGVYTYRPENIHGNRIVSAGTGIYYTLDTDGYWTVENGFDGSFRRQSDHVMLAGETESRMNKIYDLCLHSNAYIQYNRDQFNVRATGDIRWWYGDGKMYDFAAFNFTDFRYGLSARYTLPRIKTTLSADGTMYSRRGYGSSELNTDDFVLNASLSQPFLKGRLIARIEAFDLLHQLSNTQYEANSQGRTETWYRSLPHYVMAHVVYHWNKNPKKK
ncbi:MAG: outer membrane beta-barrel family protein [Bacteroidaceae bacterium]|nr:outer membrane beta-barrel family protein [Bacteroidaceae bacterium]